MSSAVHKALCVIREQADEIERLQKKCDYKDEVIDQRNAECSRQFKKIERLTAALELIAEGWEYVDAQWCAEIAREALEGER